MKTMNRIVTGVLVIALAVAGCGCKKAEYYKYDGKANIKHYDQEEFLSAIHPIMNAKTGGSFSTDLDNMATVSWQDCAYIQFTNPDEARDIPGRSRLRECGRRGWRLAGLSSVLAFPLDLG